MSKQGSDNINILNTRPFPQCLSLTKLLRPLSINILHLPLLHIEPNEYTLPDFNDVDIIIFTSPNAVNFINKRDLTALHEISKKIQIIAIGQGTANALKNHYDNFIVTPQQANSESLLAMNILQDVQNKSILIVKGLGGRTLIENTLRYRKANVDIARVYQRKMPQINPSYIKKLWQEDKVDIILISSQQALDNLFALFHIKSHSWLKNKIFYMLSPRIAAYGKQLGITHFEVCEYDNLVKKLKDSLKLNR